MEYNFHNSAIQWQISKSINTISHIFILEVIVSEILTIEIFELEKLAQGRRVLISQRRQSMENIKIYESHIMHFCTSAHH